MKIGYACLNIGVNDTQIKSCTLANATNERIAELTARNLEAVGRMLDYNGKMDIRLFRMSSDIVPFAGNPANTLDWPGLFAPQLLALGDKAKKLGIRLSMHPGQYTVLNSPRKDVVLAAIRDLEYHNTFMDAMGLGPEHKIILHVGGGYGNHREAMDMFASHADSLPPQVRKRLVLENDERIFNIEEVLEVAWRVKLPVVFDNLHHLANPAPDGDREGTGGVNSIQKWLREAAGTWGPSDGPQKIHYSQQDGGKKLGAHSTTISLEPFLAFVNTVKEAGCDPDIMLEVKDKNLSAVKCNNALAKDRKIVRLEQEWSRYKYNVLEHDPGAYHEIRQLLKEKSDYPVLAFYGLIQDALSNPATAGTGRNGAEHVWGYFRNKATSVEKNRFERLIGELGAIEAGTAGGSPGRVSKPVPDAIRNIKSFLMKIQDKYQDEYLKESLYFYLP